MSKIIHTSGSEYITSELFADGADTFTITGVTEVELEGKRRHAVQLAETEGKAWIPAFTIVKALSEIWSRSISRWVGQRVTLYRDPNVTVGKQKVGGIRVSHITGISKPETVTVKGAMNRPVSYTFEPLQDAPPPAPMITRDQWDQIAATAGEKGITDPLVWASDTLGRPLDGPQHITADEAALLIEKVKEL